MKRRSLLLLLALLLTPLGTVAQEATPTPNLMIYDDPGMTFVAPTGYYPLGQNRYDLDKLTDSLQVVGAWIGGDRTRPVRILLQQQFFEGGLDGFSTNFQQQLRGAYGDASFKNKEHTTLKNGMPAIFIQMTTGEGFSLLTIFSYLWADGSRGVALSIIGPTGTIDIPTAKKLLSDTRAVRYPRDRG